MSNDGKHPDKIISKEIFKVLNEKKEKDPLNETLAEIRCE